MKIPSGKFRYLLEYAAFLSVTRLLKIFGIDRAASICSTIAGKIGPLLPVTRIAKKNLQMVFGKDINLQQTINLLWDNFGRFIGEFPYIGDMSEEEVDKRVNLLGLEHLEEFKKNHRPFLLFTGHFANWDFAMKIAPRLYHKMAIVYRKANNPYVNNAINTHRQNENIYLVAKGPTGGKDLIKAIKAKYAIAMLVDQKMNDGIKVPFFGRPAMTAHAIARLALQFGYPIVPCQIVRTNGSHFKVIIHPQMDIQKTGNTDTDCYNIMLQINRILESWIKENPSQWLWFHNRWKKD